jgi:hypothetical protein
MSSGDEASLEQRALAAAKQAQQEREAREEADRRAREEREKEEARRTANAEWKLRSAAATKLEEILGHRTSPDDWGIGTKEMGEPAPDGDYVIWEVPVATIMLLGVGIRGNGDDGLEVTEHPGSAVGRDTGWQELTLASFGEAVNERKRREQLG